MKILIALMAFPVLFFAVPPALYVMWIFRWREFEEFEDMHGIVATAFVTAAIYIFYLCHGAPEEFARSPEMLIVSTALSLEVVYDRIALYLEARRRKVPSVPIASWILGFVAATVCGFAGYFVYRDIGHEVALAVTAQKNEEVSYWVSLLWVISFALAFGNKYWQGRTRVRARKAAEDEAEKTHEPAQQ
ncbi:hypothetical protein [Paraburkholderia silvatlantica]|uniref:Uncharacterized protein n=1 Tax=Paraburkholderia silvatlantica TaxID=321895 RepID=A0A2U0ZX00_9BURK|nr:hypothetical protein [Paraburkholderia silvatlantica]MBB2928539.1 hypothetical protein [Paraburkholderia silvatlantica]PVY23581.1 hypothetical protein C7411_12867 [Paraburkholderia silvatlantica]PXW30819.1 hypothetical protein C7413_12767 [Paraburkholderia silvatlantica]PYE13886.1 hypothetical protein C7410_14235 [Paraburkholderia silvatlantica]TDQ77767.1 hypothetical protein C7412_13325 [Paraburkholderia silvatlantica]